MENDLLTAAGLLGAALIGARSIALQRSWLRPDEPGSMAAGATGAGLLAVSLFAEWNTATCLLAVVLAAVNLYGLSQTLIRQRTGAPGR